MFLEVSMLYADENQNIFYKIDITMILEQKMIPLLTKSFFIHCI